MPKRNLFDPIVSPEKLHPLFKGIRTSANAEPGRIIANEVFGTFEDPDGNFLEQFQSTGLDSRMFELYMYAYLSTSGFEVDRRHSRPDFIITNAGVRAAVEVTTSNRPRAFDLDQIMKDVESLTPEVERNTSSKTSYRSD